MIDYASIPEATRYTIDAWAERAQPRGSFVQAVLENNLAEAVGRADEGNIAALHSIVAYVYNHVPAARWGSPAKVKAWSKAKFDALGATGTGDEEDANA
jgi:hypothetical protein